MRQFLNKYKTVLYFSWFDYITEKHLEVFKDLGVMPTIVSSKALEEFDLSLYPPRETLLIAQTSCLATNKFFASKAVLSYTKILFQDGMRLFPPLKGGARFKFSLLLDKLSSRTFYRLNQVYYKNMYDYFLLTTRAAVDEAMLAYRIPQHRVLLHQNRLNKPCKPFLPLKTSNPTIIFIDQPIEKIFNLSEHEIFKLYDEIYSSLLKTTSAEKIFLKSHPSLDYKRELRVSFHNDTDGELGPPNDAIFITFYSTLGFDLLQNGGFVFFVNFRSFFDEENFFVLPGSHFQLDVHRLKQSQLPFLENNRKNLLGIFA